MDGSDFSGTTLHKRPSAEEEKVNRNWNAPGNQYFMASCCCKH